MDLTTTRKLSCCESPPRSPFASRKLGVASSHAENKSDAKSLAAAGIPAAPSSRSAAVALDWFPPPNASRAVVAVSRGGRCCRQQCVEDALEFESKPPKTSSSELRGRLFVWNVVVTTLCPRFCASGCPFASSSPLLESPNTSVSRNRRHAVSSRSRAFGELAPTREAVMSPNVGDKPCRVARTAADAAAAAAVALALALASSAEPAASSPLLSKSARCLNVAAGACRATSSGAASSKVSSAAGASRRVSGSTCVSAAPTCSTSLLANGAMPRFPSAGNTPCFSAPRAAMRTICSRSTNRSAVFSTTAAAAPPIAPGWFSRSSRMPSSASFRTRSL
mmetsp:Transcript_2146/g.8258  ORF Transcript_2146/g.8258 Transcript_2146/m.8258 type:complete len:336 (-) Transcript_2146:344-1351(-)